jgi:hypothetical protein
MTDQNLNERVRAYLCQIAGQGVPITYQALASALGLVPPQTIRQLTDVLEVLMAEDVAADRPMIAALVVSKTGSGLPAAGFFECAARLGRFDGNADLPSENTRDHDAAVTFYEAEFKAVIG